MSDRDSLVQSFCFPDSMTEVHRGWGAYLKCHNWFVSAWGAETHVPHTLPVAQYCPVSFMSLVSVNGLWYQTQSH